MLKVYCGKIRSDVGYLEMLNPNFGIKKRKNIFGDKDVFDDFKDPVVNVVNNPEEADFLLIPHNYFSIEKNQSYLNDFSVLSNKLSKKIIIFAMGDSNKTININNSIVFRMSQYLSDKRENEIIMPAYATDLYTGLEINLNKKNQKPSIGFCGWADSKGLFGKLSFLVRNLFILRGPYKSGVYFRKKAISIIGKSKLIKSDFIIRNSYGGSSHTVGLDPVLARKEYKENIIKNDFTLAPKGDGNFSVRFYEVLSLGRIPVLIDTDCTMPLDKDLDYSEFSIKVDYKDLKDIDKIIYDLYEKISDEKWLNMQKRARKVFEDYLRIDSFFRFIFSPDNFKKYLQ